MFRPVILLLFVYPALADELPLAERLSGYAQMSGETRAMQDDDAANPAMLWVAQGEQLWLRRDGAAAKSCSDCHGETTASMKGVAARYPRVAPDERHALNLEQRINRCRSERQQASAFAYESRQLLALGALIARASRGMPIQSELNETSRPFIEAGQAIFQRRAGQLNLACRHCHDDNWGKQLGGNVIPQAHPTGYPVYRLEWQGLGSLQRRLRSCMSSLRAQAYEYGSEELVQLEYYLMWRARGMPWEAPAIRP